MESTFQNYVIEATGDSLRGMAASLGLDPSVFRRQVAGESTLRVETVVALCRQYDLPLGPAFVQAGFLTAEEVAGMNERTNIRSFTDKELAREMLRRASRDESVDVPLSEIDDPFLNVPLDNEGAAAALRQAHLPRRRKR